MLTNNEPALRSHEDLFRIIRTLKDRYNVPRSTLTSEYFSQRGKGFEPQIADQHRAFNLAIRVMTSVCCSSENQCTGQNELGSNPVVWGGNKSLQDFLGSTFPKKYHPTLNGDDGSLPGIRKQLKAIKLRKLARLRFRGTDDLKNHLRLDQKTGIVEIYPYTSILKEHLIATQGSGDAQTSNNSNFRGTISHQLALETLNSLQSILFPWDDKSQKFLRSLVSKGRFDPDCLSFGSAGYRREIDAKISFYYWGSRLMDLYDEIENPKPRGSVQGWLERRSKARHTMMAAIAAVIIAAFLGFLTLAVSIFQAWVSFQQWKYSVPSIEPSSS